MAFPGRTGRTSSNTKIRRAPFLAEFHANPKPSGGSYTSAIRESECFEAQRRLKELLQMFSLLRTGAWQDQEKATLIAKQNGFAVPDHPEQSLGFEVASQMYRKATTGFDAQGRITFHCLDILSGLYSLVAKAIAEQRPWLSCPNCGKRLQATTNQQRYCSPRCASSARQKRFRSNEERDVKRMKKKPATRRKRRLARAKANESKQLSQL
jgi:hypothetical protein